MSHRQRDTHDITVYDEIATGETDSLGDPVTETQAVIETTAVVRDYPRSSAGGLEARDAGETPTAEKELILQHADGDSVTEGQYVTIARRGASATTADPVFSVTRILEDSPVRGGAVTHRLTLARDAGTTRGDL